MGQDKDVVDALRPFAKYANHMKSKWSGYHADSAFYDVKRPGAPQITYGDFRRAASVIDALEKPNEPR